MRIEKFLTTFRINDFLLVHILHSLVHHAVTIVTNWGECVNDFLINFFKKKKSNQIKSSQILLKNSYFCSTVQHLTFSMVINYFFFQLIIFWGSYCLNFHQNDEFAHNHQIVSKESAIFFLSSCVLFFVASSPFLNTFLRSNALSIVMAGTFSLSHVLQTQRKKWEEKKRRKKTWTIRWRYNEHDIEKISVCNFMVRLMKPFFGFHEIWCLLLVWWKQKSGQWGLKKFVSVSFFIFRCSWCQGWLKSHEYQKTTN